MKIIFKKETDLRPENLSELEALSKKWNITLNELCRAIVETGTTNTRDLKAHIRKGSQSLNQKYNLRKLYTGLHIVGRD